LLSNISNTITYLIDCKDTIDGLDK